MLSARAQGMMATLPVYYQGEPLVERIVQAWANEHDRRDARQTALATQLVPTQATDEFGLLRMWEIVLGLPPAPADATVDQRQQQVSAALRKLDSGSAADVLDALMAAAGTANFVIHRDTPAPLSDTLEFTGDPDSYTATAVGLLARRMWPAHRLLLMDVGDGFLLDLSNLDADTF